MKIKPRRRDRHPGRLHGSRPGRAHRTQQAGQDGAGLSQGVGEVPVVHSRAVSGHAVQPGPNDGDSVGPDATPDARSLTPGYGAVEAYNVFHEGSSKKFVIDPHPA
jgi:hypothetical protein